LADELEPYCNSLLRVYCDIPRNLHAGLSERFGEPTTPVILTPDLTQAAMSYTVYIEILCGDDDLDKIRGVITHMIAEVSVDGIGLDIDPIEESPNQFIFDLANDIQAMSMHRADDLEPLATYEFSNFVINDNGKSPVALFESSFDERMVIFEENMPIEDVDNYSAKGTAYVYGDVDSPSLLIDESGMPILIGAYKYGADKPDGTPANSFEWIVTRIIMVPRMPNLDVLTHCLNSHPMLTGFGDGVFNFISPMLLISDVPSMQYLMMLGTLFTGFIDGNGATFVDHLILDDEVLSEVPIRDLYLYLTSIDEFYDVVGDFNIAMLKEHVRDFIGSADSYDKDDVIRH